jgi:hypothetical protein
MTKSKKTTTKRAPATKRKAKRMIAQGAKAKATRRLPRAAAAAAAGSAAAIADKALTPAWNPTLPLSKQPFKYIPFGDIKDKDCQTKSESYEKIKKSRQIMRARGIAEFPDQKDIEGKGQPWHDWLMKQKADLGRCQKSKSGI